MKRLLLFFCILLPIFSNATVYDSVESIPNVHIADRTRYLTNPDGIVSVSAQTIADSIMADVWHRTSAELVAVVVESIGDRDANELATELFTKWGIGKKDRDNGVLLLIVNDTHDVVIRTGYGAEGALPDIVAGRIIRDDMFPLFRSGDYDGAVITGLRRVNSVLTDPAVAEELKSEYANNAGVFDISDTKELTIGFIIWGTTLLALMLIVVFISRKSIKNKPIEKQYEVMNNVAIGALIVTALGIGIPIIAWLIAKSTRNKIRSTPPVCPRCGTPMMKMAPALAVAGLTPTQQTEARIGATDFDTWRCPADGYTKMIPFPGRNRSSFAVCNVCGARANKLTRTYTSIHPTRYRSGQGIREYQCMHCGNMTRVPFVIPRLASSSGNGGGGFGGGSFGGGRTGGGGASGRW